MLPCFAYRCYWPGSLLFCVRLGPPTCSLDALAIHRRNIGCHPGRLIHVWRSGVEFGRFCTGLLTWICANGVWGFLVLVFFFYFLLANAVWFKYSVVCCHIYKTCLFLICKTEIWELCRCSASSNCFMVWVKANSFPFALFHAGSPLSVLLVTQPRLLISALISGVVYRFVV